MRNEALPMANTKAEIEGGIREMMVNYSFIDKQFLPMMQIGLKEGRNLSDSLMTDRKSAFLVNEAFVEKMGWRSAIGKSLEGFGYKGQIVGVVKNFYYKSLHNIIEPMIFVYHGERVSSVMLKTASTDLSSFKTTWKKYFPGNPFAYQFLDESYEAQYRKDDLTMTLFTWFTVLAILISCLGLYGLVSLVAVQRTKEIGIRKVLGASVTDITAMLSRDFVKLVGISILIATPIAWYVMHNWLQEFAYRTSISWWIFALAGLAALFIALITVSFQAIKAALANPVKSLRTE
jgi:putative ABC transport system permease protein